MLRYLEDIQIFLEGPELHNKPVLHTLTLLLDDGITTELKKGNQFLNTIEYLGHVISSEQMEVSQLTFYAIWDL